MFSVYRCCGSATDDLVVCFLGFGNISYIYCHPHDRNFKTNKKTN